MLRIDANPLKRVENRAAPTRTRFSRLDCRMHPPDTPANPTSASINETR
jgi:hypothetical protein